VGFNSSQVIRFAIVGDDMKYFCRLMASSDIWEVDMLEYCEKESLALSYRTELDDMTVITQAPPEVN
jgi:hypothetical protein